MGYRLELNIEDIVSFLRIKKALCNVSGNFTVSSVKIRDFMRVNSTVDNSIDGVIETINSFKLTEVRDIKEMLYVAGYLPCEPEKVDEVWMKDGMMVNICKKVCAEYEDGNNTYIYYLEKVENI